MNLTSDPIPELIRKIAIPASIGFFFNTMFNFVDTWFAGRISTDALAALSLSFPVFFMILASGSGLSQGSTALIANALGRGDKAGAALLFCQAIVFALGASVVLTVAGLLLSPALFRTLGAEGSYLTLSLEYMNVIMAGAGFFILQMTLNTLLNARGETRAFRNVLIVGFFLNVGLDPWFLYGGAGVPAMGLAGIALATVLVQFLGCVYLTIHLLKLDIAKEFHPGLFIPRWPRLREIAGQSVPAGLNMLTVALGIFVITWFASRFGKEPVAGYGIATRIEQMILLPTIGLNFAVLSLAGQNFGAGRIDRVKESWHTTLKAGVLLMTGGGLILALVRGPMMRFFTDDPGVLAQGTTYLGIAALTLPAYPILFQTVFLLQGMKRPIFGLILGVYRQFAAPCLVFWLLAFVLGWKSDGIWWGILLITWSAAGIAVWRGSQVLRSAETQQAGRETPKPARP
jgi:putative MATE family efflux protein